MRLARKIFFAVFLSTFILGTVLLWSAHRYVKSRAESDFVSRYMVFSKILADALTRLDSNTEALMLNAAQVVVEKDKESGLLSTDELRKLQGKLGVTHLFVVDRDGRFIRSTNEDPKGIPNLFSFSPIYKKLLTGESSVEATPIIKPNPEPKPFKFLSVANADRSRIIEVGIRLDFIANTLVEAVKSDKSLLSMSLYAPDGTPFGTFSENNVIFETQKSTLPTNLEKPIVNGDEIHFYTKVQSSHPTCAQCEVSGTAVGGEYYYVLESSVSTAELTAIQSRANILFLIVGLVNLIVSYFAARLLAKRLVKNVRVAVERVRSLKSNEGVNGRIGLDADDEIGFLTNEFDRLLDSLEKSQTDLIEAEKAQSKIELAQIVAHNIKSPILAIEMMLPGLVTVPERMRRVLKNSVKEIKELSAKLKTDTASVSLNTHIDPKTDLVFLPIFLDDLVSQKAQEFVGKPETFVTLEISKQTENLFVKACSQELKSVLSNLINNAVESYGSRGGSVVVELASKQSHCLIRIADKGCGIPAEYLKKIGKHSFTFKGERGTGLGLTHAFATIRSLGGQIEVESQIDFGTAVTIRLPNYSDEFRRADSLERAHTNYRKIGLVNNVDALRQV